MACASASAAPVIEFKRLGACRKSSSTKKPRHKHPLTATVAGGAPLKLKAKLPLELNLPLRRKLSTRGRDWLSDDWFAKQVWEALKILDAADVDKPEASSEVVEIYSLRIVSKLLAGKPEGWNREHLWPRSYGLMSGPSLTDLHNIRPADVNVNSSRGNKFYGECHVSSSNCRKPATRESAFDTEADKERWAPPRQVRGDIARAIMYMAVCMGSINLAEALIFTSLILQTLILRGPI
ncbi:hypothetical protein C3L33_05664, partial [Rhododendron williamsianum]